MIIEKATVSDAEEILSLQKLAYRSEAEIYNDFNIPPLIQTSKEIKQDFENQFFLKAVEDKKIIGSVRAHVKEETCYIGRVIVHPNFQNRGIGNKLMSEIEKVFDTCKRFELFTGDKSERNLYLYQKLGYRIFKTAKITDQTTIVFLEKKIGFSSFPSPRTLSLELRIALLEVMLRRQVSPIIENPVTPCKRIPRTDVKSVGGTHGCRGRQGGDEAISTPAWQMGAPCTRRDM